MTKPQPVRNLQRLLEAQSIFIKYGFDDLVNREELQSVRKMLNVSRQGDIDSSLTRAERIRLMLEELGPTYIKAGQIIGSQYSALPRDIAEELDNLHDNASPFPSEQVMEIIEQETGKPLENAYHSFNLDAFAAASIAQVHRAHLDDDTPVAVKVQRPSIRAIVEADLEIIYRTAKLLEGTIGANRGFVDVVDEFKVSLNSELDFRNEARNAQRLSHNLRDVYGVRVPDIYWEYVTDKVLTMEYIEGVKITDVSAIKAAGLDPHQLANHFTEAMSQQILIDGFFHGDPHPGNVIVNTGDGTITFIDVGMMGYLDEESRRELGNMVIALQEPDTRELVRVAKTLGTQFKELDERPLRRDLEHILNRYMVASLSRVSFADMMYELMNTLFEYGIRLPASLTLAIKALIQTQEIASQLNPNLQISDVANTVSDQLFWEQLRPSVIQDRLNETTAEVLRLAPVASDAIESLLREAKTGQLTIHVDTSDLQTQLESLSENNKRITIGLTVAGTTVGSAIAMSVNPAEAWSFIPFLGVLGFTISIAIAGGLMLKLLWEIWGP